MANRAALLFFILAGSASIAFAQENIPPAPLQPVQQTQPLPPAPVDQASANEFQQWLQKSEQTQSSAPTSPPPFMAPGAAQPASTTVVTRPRPRGPMSYEEGQQVMLATLPTTSRQSTQEEEIAFNAMVHQNMPMTPSQIVRLRQQVDMSQRAAAVTPNIPPKPVSSTIMVNLAPGTTPPAIRLAQGFVSALVFVDSTGSPWPIATFDIGNPKAVNLQWDGKTNVILIQANSPYTNGDIVVRLIGLPTPITLTLLTGQRVVDYRADIHVSGIGPNTKEVPIGTSLPNSANVLLLGILDGVAPAGSRLLTVRGADAQAWLLGQKIYLRTRMTVLSPGWIGKMSSPDGMQAYELPKTSSVLISRYGEPTELKIEGF